MADRQDSTPATASNGASWFNDSSSGQKLNLSEVLVLAVSSRALFDLSVENNIFEEKGEAEYARYQQEHEEDILKPGVGFSLIKAFLRLNELARARRVTEVIIVSRNNADSGIRIFNSVAHYGLDVTRAAFTSGESIARYLNAYDVDLFLSAYEDDVAGAVESGIAAGLVYDSAAEGGDAIDQIRIAFDGDSVLFSDEADQIYRSRGLVAFQEHERAHAGLPLPEGPFAKFLKTLSFLQRQFNSKPSPIRTALVTARNSPAHERVIRTLRHWGVHIDEAFFLGGLPKNRVLDAFRPHIFFDDQDFHCRAAAGTVPTARVPLKQVAPEPANLQQTKQSSASDAVDP